MGAPGPGRRTTDRPGPHAPRLPGGRGAVNHEGQTTSAPPDRHLLGRWTPWIVVLVFAALCGAIFTASSQTGRDREPAGLDPAFVYDVTRFQVIPPERIGYREVARRSRRGSSARPPSPSGPPTRSWPAATSEWSSSRPTAPGATRRPSRTGRCASRCPPRATCSSASGASSCGGRSRVRSNAWLSVPGEKARLTSMAVDGETVFVADAGARAVWHFASDGRRLGRIGDRDPERDRAGLRGAEPVLRRARRARRPLAHRRPRPPPGHGLHARRRPGDCRGARRRTRSRASAAAATRRTSPCSPTARIVTSEKGIARVKVYDAEGRFVTAVVGPDGLDTEVGPCDVAVGRHGPHPRARPGPRRDPHLRDPSRGPTVKTDSRRRVLRSTRPPRDRRGARGARREAAPPAPGDGHGVLRPRRTLRRLPRSRRGATCTRPSTRGRVDERPSRDGISCAASRCSASGSAAGAAAVGRPSATTRSGRSIRSSAASADGAPPTACTPESAVKAVHVHALCGHCDLCTAFFEPDSKLDTGAENQLCPTGAIRRHFIEDPYFSYEIDEQLCIGCAKCVKGCAMFGNGSMFLQIRHDRCNNCNACSIADACPARAFRRVPASTPYLLKSAHRGIVELRRSVLPAVCLTWLLAGVAWGDERVPAAGVRVGLPDARDDGARAARVRARDARRRRPRHRLVAGDLARAEDGARARAWRGSAWRASSTSASTARAACARWARRRTSCWPSSTPRTPCRSGSWRSSSCRWPSRCSPGGASARASVPSARSRTWCCFDRWPFRTGWSGRSGSWPTSTWDSPCTSRPLGAAFVICRYDPFVGFFRLTGGFDMLVLGGCLLAIGVFVGRPYCRFLCPYGVLLDLTGRLSRWRVTITPDACVQCRLCEASCPYGAINLPSPRRAAPERARAGRRLVVLFLLLPVVVGALRLPLPASRGGRSPACTRPWTSPCARRPSAGCPNKEASDEVQAWRRTGESLARPRRSGARRLQASFVRGGWWLGGWIGLVVAVMLIGLATLPVRTDYEADRGRCLSCARCFEYCPTEHERRKALARGGAMSASRRTWLTARPPSRRRSRSSCSP